MKLKQIQTEALVYADLFDWPLTARELGTRSNELGGYFFLPGRERLVGLRKKREKISTEKKKTAQKTAGFLKKIPSVKAIFLTGSVAVGNAKKDADIDLMVVTSTNTLWITRLVVFMLLKSLRLLRSPKNYQDRICPNIFVDLNHLRVSDENIYTAHEILQTKPLFDRGGIYKKWLKENEWTRKYLPKAYLSCLGNFKFKISNLNSNFKFKIENCLLGPLELIVFAVQWLYMKRKITNEHVGWGFAFFHPNDLSKTIPEKYRQRLLKYIGK